MYKKVMLMLIFSISILSCNLLKNALRHKLDVPVDETKFSHNYSHKFYSVNDINKVNIINKLNKKYSDNLSSYNHKPISDKLTSEFKKLVDNLKCSQSSTDAISKFEKALKETIGNNKLNNIKLDVDCYEYADTDCNSSTDIDSAYALFYFKHSLDCFVDIAEKLAQEKGNQELAAAIETIVSKKSIKEAKQSVKSFKTKTGSEKYEEELWKSLCDDIATLNVAYKAIKS